MPTEPINEVIFDADVTLNLDLTRMSTETSAAIAVMLDDMIKDLTLILVTNESLTSFGKRRIKQQIAEATEVIGRYYGVIANESAIASLTAGQIAHHTSTVSLSTATGGIVKKPPPLAGLLHTDNYMKALASDAIVQGATQKDWWNRQARDTVWKFEREVRLGLLAAETNDQIIKRVMGAVDTLSHTNADSLVRTSVMTVANDARAYSYEQHSKVIKALEWSSTLDNKTCPECSARDNKRWGIKTKKPIGHSIPFSRPPKHFQCRCSLVAVTKSYKELGFPDMKEPSKSARASIDGMVYDKSFEDFMTRKGAAFTEDVLGKGRFELYKANKLTLEDLLNNKGNMLTVKQLKDKYSK